MNKSDKYWSILQYNVEWLKFSETKASILLTDYGIIITIIYTNASDVLSAVKNNSFIATMSIMAATSSIISIYFAFKCINPRLKNLNPNSIIYFGHIKEKYSSFEDYYNMTDGILQNENEFSKQIAEQIHVNSQIAWKKFFNVTWSIRFFIFSIIILLVTIFKYLITG
jgi:hypothetical protein